MSLFNVKDKHRAYRERVQSYAHEEKSLWEDFRHGLFLGSTRFVDEMRRRYLSQEPNKEMPQQRAAARLEDPERLLLKASHFLGCNVDHFKESERISPSDREDRDVLVYFLWQTGKVTNETLGELFGVTYSSISHIVKGFKERLGRESKLQETMNELYSQIKM